MNDLYICIQVGAQEGVTRWLGSTPGLARCGTVFPVSVVVGAAVPAAVCRRGLCPCCPGAGRCFLGVIISSALPSVEYTLVGWDVEYRGGALYQLLNRQRIDASSSLIVIRMLIDSSIM